MHRNLQKYVSLQVIFVHAAKVLIKILATQDFKTLCKNKLQNMF